MLPTIDYDALKPMTGEVTLGDKVRIYRNLRNGAWSVLYDQCVVGHVIGALLEDARFVIQPAGQARVRREGRKHVHAFVEGILRGWHSHPMGASCYPSLYGTPVTYNPYQHDTFVVERTWEPVTSARWAQVKPHGRLEISAYDPHPT
jgi:hypothetical protein